MDDYLNLYLNPFLETVILVYKLVSSILILDAKLVSMLVYNTKNYTHHRDMYLKIVRMKLSVILSTTTTFLG